MDAFAVLLDNAAFANGETRVFDVLDLVTTGRLLDGTVLPCADPCFKGTPTPCPPPTTCRAGLVGDPCWEDVECDTAPAAGDGICGPTGGSGCPSNPATGALNAVDAFCDGLGVCLGTGLCDAANGGRIACNVNTDCDVAHHGISGERFLWTCSGMAGGIPCRSFIDCPATDPGSCSVTTTTDCSDDSDCPATESCVGTCTSDPATTCVTSSDCCDPADLIGPSLVDSDPLDDFLSTFVARFLAETDNPTGSCVNLGDPSIETDSLKNAHVTAANFALLTQCTLNGLQGIFRLSGTSFVTVEFREFIPTPVGASGIRVTSLETDLIPTRLLPPTFDDGRSSTVVDSFRVVVSTFEGDPVEVSDSDILIRCRRRVLCCDEVDEDGG